MDMSPDFDRVPPATKRPPIRPAGPASLARLLVFAIACLALMAAALLLPPLPMNLGTLPVGP